MLDASITMGRERLIAEVLSQKELATQWQFIEVAIHWFGTGGA